MASPFTFIHEPNCRNLSSNIGTIRPSFVGPTFISRLPPQLCEKRQGFDFSLSLDFPNKLRNIFEFMVNFHDIIMDIIGP